MIESFSSTLLDKIEKTASKHGLEPRLVASIVSVESRGNTWAMRYEEHWKYLFNVKMFAKEVRSSVDTEITAQKTSWGLMQVMGTVARELGFMGWLSVLCDPEMGLEYGCMKFKKCLDKHNNLKDAIASYNAGRPIITKDGLYVNQDYVDKIMHYYNDFKEIDFIRV